MNSTLSVKHSFEDLFETIIDNFPYPLERTGCAHGDLELSTPDEDLEYSEEFTFEVGKMFDQTLVAGGWIDLRKDGNDSEIYISGFFGIALNGDFENNKILSDDKAVIGHFDLETQSWELEIDNY